jgi:hypothetical protein
MINKPKPCLTARSLWSLDKDWTTAGRFFLGTTMCREKTLSAFGERILCEAMEGCPRGASPEGKEYIRFYPGNQVTERNGRLIRKIFP